MAERNQYRQQYMSLRQQQEALGLLSGADTSGPISGYLCYRGGPFIATTSLVGAAFVFWRAGFRAFYLVKYGRGRVATLAFSLITAAHGGFLHEMFVNGKLRDYWANEDPWYYAKSAAIAHQPGLLICFTGAFTLNYVFSSRSALLPVVDTLYPKETRFKLFRYIASRYKPYYRSIASVWVMSTLLMTYVGYRALEERQQVIFEVTNRKTLSLKEG